MMLRGTYVILTMTFFVYFPFLSTFFSLSATRDVWFLIFSVDLIYCYKMYRISEFVEWILSPLVKCLLLFRLFVSDGVVLSSESRRVLFIEIMLFRL